MIIALLHQHYNKQHLEEVKSEMMKLGAPTIRAIWDETQGMWRAIEGCHRIRAAKELGITPIIKEYKGKSFRNDAGEIYKSSDLLNDWKVSIITFEEE